MPRKPKIRQIVPAGNHAARLAGITDVPNDEKDWGDRWRFDFESDKSDPDTGQKYTVSQFTGRTLSPKSNLSRLLGWMTGQTLSELEDDAPDIDKFVGRRFDLTISHEVNSKGEKRAKIVFLTPLDTEVEEIPF
mgnify:CR=1 FL=1